MNPTAPPPADKGDSPRQRARRALQESTDLRTSGRLDEALAAIIGALETAELTNDPELQIAAARELGLTLLASSRLQEAEAVLAEVLRKSETYFGEASQRWAVAAAELALAHRARGDTQGAHELLRKAAKVTARSLGQDDPVTIALERNEETSRKTTWPSLVYLSWGADTDDWRQHLEDIYLPATSFAVNLSAADFSRLSRYLRKDLPLGPFVGAFVAQSALGQALSAEGGLRPLPYDGLALARRVYELRSSTLGDDHPQTLNSLVLFSQATEPRDPGQAIELARTGARHSERVLGRTHIDTLGAYESLADILEGNGQRQEAQRLRGENAELRIADADFLGEEQPQVVNLAGTLTEPLTNALDAESSVHVLRSDYGSAQWAEHLVLDDRIAYEAPAGRPVELESPEAAAEPSDNAELIRRTAHLELDPPDPIRTDERFDVITYVDDAPAEGSGTGELVIDPPSGVTELTLSAWLVVSRHFEIEDDAIQPLLLDPREPCTRKLTYRVHAAHLDEFRDEDPEVRVLFSYRGWPSGEVRRMVPLAQATEEALQ